MPIMAENKENTLIFRRLAVLLFWIGFCFILEEVGDRADSLQSENSVYDAQARPKVIPGGMMPNFGGDYMVRLFYIDTEYFGEWKVKKSKTCLDMRVVSIFNHFRMIVR